MKNLLIFLLSIMLVIAATPLALADEAVNNSGSSESVSVEGSSETDAPAQTASDSYTAYLKFNFETTLNWYAWTWGQGEGIWVKGQRVQGYDGQNKYVVYKYENLDKNVVFAGCSDDVPNWQYKQEQSVDVALDFNNRVFVVDEKNSEGKYTGYITALCGEDEMFNNSPSEPTDPAASEDVSSEAASSEYSPATDPTSPSGFTHPTAPTGPTSDSSYTQPFSDSNPTNPSSGGGIKPSSDSEPTGFTKPSSSNNEPSVIKPSSDNTNPTASSGTGKINEKGNQSVVIPKLNLRTATVKCGKVITLRVSGNGGKKVKYTSSSTKVAQVSSAGKVSALRKGIAKITAKVGSKKLYFTIKITSSPKLSKSSISVKKGKTVTVKIIGKCSTVKNTYTNTKKAKVISKRTAVKLKIKGLKTGKTTLKVKVNGVVLKLKVKVK